MRILLLLVMLLTACEVGLSSDPAEDCSEFTWNTMRGGDRVTCRMLWCRAGSSNAAYGGPATLWCWPPLTPPSETSCSTPDAGGQ